MQEHFKGVDNGPKVSGQVARTLINIADQPDMSGEGEGIIGVICKLIGANRNQQERDRRFSLGTSHKSKAK